MKIALEDSDIEKIATAVAKKVGAKAPKAKAEADDAEAGEGEGEADTSSDFEDGGEGGEGGGEDETPTPDDVKAALTLVSKKFDQDTAMAILKKTGGASALSKLAEGKRAAVIKACKAKAK